MAHPQGWPCLLSHGQPHGETGGNVLLRKKRARNEPPVKPGPKAG